MCPLQILCLEQHKLTPPIIILLHDLSTYFGYVEKTVESQLMADRRQAACYKQSCIDTVKRHRSNMI